MPRRSRILSKSGIYHVMLRGNERKEIFKDVKDRIRFIDTLYEKKKLGEFIIYAYCLMNNHVHIVIKQGKDEISRIMKRINTSYATYYNKKYERVGHVFQDRYKSEAIESERYLLTVIRYIHNNPVKAGICADASQFAWSSYNEYVNKSLNIMPLVEIEEVLGIYSNSKANAIKEFIEFTKTVDNTEYFENEDLTTKEAKKQKIDEYIGSFLEQESTTINEIKDDKVMREKLICYLKGKPGASVRMISEVLGMDRNIVQRVK